MLGTFVAIAFAAKQTKVLLVELHKVELYAIVAAHTMMPGAFRLLHVKL